MRILPILFTALTTAAISLHSITAMAQTDVRMLNDGNLVLDGIPEIPDWINRDLRQYQNVRFASFQAWTNNGEGLIVRSRFGDLAQLHRVDIPGGARSQITFFDEPPGSVSKSPGSNQLAFTMDTGGSEFSQIFLLQPTTGQLRMLTDGESRNRSVVWDDKGEMIAYTSTERDGRSNDVWIMEVDEPESREIAHQSSDGSLWVASDFSDDNNQLLLTQFVSAVQSATFIKDRTSGELIQLAGGPDQPGVNIPVGFDANDQGVFLITDRGGEFSQLAWMPVDAPDELKMITASIEWSIEDVVLSDDGKKAAFVANAGGLSELYLLDTRTHRYQRVESIPTGVIGRMRFRPDGRALALTINTPKTPSDTFVLALGKSATAAGALKRWTFSEVGGLDTATFIEPTLINYPSFDGREIPAWYYRPEGEGPFPVVVSIHGGPEGQARPTFSSTYQMWLAKLGVAVLVPNVRGSSGYGRSYLQLDNGMQREDSVKDIGALLDWVDKQPALDQSRVAVFGGSYGGYMVLASAVHYSDRLKAGVNIVGISNFVTFLTNTQDYRRDLRRVEYGDERIPEMRRHLEAISPLNNTEKIRIPMMVVQGQNDPRVPVTEAEQIVKALRQQDLPVWYMNALNEGHGYARKENRDTYQQAAIFFLQQHLVNPAVSDVNEASP